MPGAFPALGVDEIPLVVLEPFFFFGSSNHEVGNTSGPEIYDMARLLSASAAPDARQQTLPSLIHLLSVRGGAELPVFSNPVWF